MEEHTSQADMSENSEHGTQIKKAANRSNIRLMFMFNGLLLAGLIILYILFFNSINSGNEAFAPDNSNSRIAFINTDSLKKHYLMVQEMHDTLEKRYNELDSEMKGRQSAFEARAREFQNKVNSNSITLEQAQKTEQQLMMEQQTLMELKDKYTTSLAEQEYGMNERFVDSVSNFLTRYNKNKTYDFILGYTKGAGILMADERLDITNMVIEGLNKEYLSANKR